MDFNNPNGIWYVWLLVFIVVVFVILMPKKNLTWIGVFLTFGVAGQLTWIGDSIIGGGFDLFDLGKSNALELSDAFLVSFVPPCISTIYVNFYKSQKKWLFALIFTLLSFLLECGLVNVGYMENKNWETWYGIPVYLTFYGFFSPWLLSLYTKKQVNLDTFV